MHLHILGICGTFMGGVAALARAAGHRVSGSDTGVYPPMSALLEGLEIPVTDLDDPRQFDSTPDCVVVGNVMTRGMPAIEKMLDDGLPYCSGPEWLARHVLRDKWVLAVAGTHGKTTTASILAWLLEEAGLDPGFLIGGVPANFAESARLGGGTFFVVEADEYDTAFFDKRSKFVHYRPRTLVLNNLEFDHADIFPDLAAIETQFHHLIRTVPGSGLIIYRAGDSALTRVLGRGCWSATETFAVDDDGAHWHAHATDGFLEVAVDGVDQGRAKWALMGRHNRENALAAIAAARHAGVSTGVALAGLESFGGVKRRLEKVGDVAGIAVFDDFAHHPTAIATTLEGLRREAPHGRIIAVLEPRSNTMRSGVHADRLADALRAADVVWLFRRPDLRWEPADVCDALDQARVCDSHDELLRSLTQSLRPGDRVVIMSNGGFGNIHQRLLDRLSKGATEA